MWVGPGDEAAEDIVQQAFIALAGAEVVPENPVAWLYQTSRNIGINERKKRQRRNRRESAVAKGEHQSSSIGKSVEATELLENLNRLSDMEREVVVAKLWAGLSFEDIAKATGQSRATVWRRYQTAINNLRILYGEPCKTKK
ncbi:MAG: sigma-70 family RNA polymerase sigma factor [Pirellulaceae bacterium]